MLGKPRADLTHEPTHLAQVTGAIGAASGIAKEDERLLGQALMDGARHRETAKTGIEYANRGVVHNPAILAHRQAHR